MPVLWCAVSSVSHVFDCIELRTRYAAALVEAIKFLTSESSDVNLFVCTEGIYNCYAI